MNGTNVIFLSPHFPEQFYNFCDRLKRLGANVLGIGDCPYDGLSAQCRDSLTEYHYVSSLEDYDGVFRAAAFFIFKYGRIDYIDSQNEHWLELEAHLRKDFNITTGFQAAELARFKYKSAMKESYADLMQNAKVLISNYDALLSVYFVAAVIYILINCLLNQISVAIARRGGPEAAQQRQKGAVL